MTHLLIDFTVLEKFVEEFLPEVSKHIKVHSTTNPIMTYVGAKWFIPIFIDCLPPDVLVTVWDMYIRHGIVTLFWVALMVFNGCQVCLSSTSYPYDSGINLNRLG